MWLARFRQEHESLNSVPYYFTATSLRNKGVGGEGVGGRLLPLCSDPNALQFRAQTSDARVENMQRINMH